MLFFSLRIKFRIFKTIQKNTKSFRLEGLKENSNQVLLIILTILRDSKTEYQWHSNNNNHWVVKRVLFFTKQNSLQQFIPGLLCLTKSHWRINNTVDFCVCYREIHLFSKWKLCCDLTVSAPLKVRSWFCFLNNFLVWTTLAEYFWGVFEMSFVSIIKTF